MVVAGSQDTEDEFSRGAWMNMKKDMDLNENDPNSILSQSNIAIVMRKASLKQLAKGKVPHLCVLIKSVNFCDASAVFRDPSGEMQGTVHRKLLEEYQSDMKPGTALVLRQVSVLSPSLRNHYLNITPSNLIQVYSAVDCNTSLSASQTLPSRVQEVSGNPVSGDEEKTAGCVTDPHNDGQFGSVARKGTENQGNTKHSPDKPSTFHGSVDGVKGNTAMAGRPKSLNDQEFNHKNTNNNNACDTNSTSTESTAMSGGLGNTACENPTGAFDTENLDALLEGIEEDELFADF
ncbi:homologous recombination OB-fold protein-like [Ptychodera flava]|uniref:homologous recombination OB-fold protein-like n=1 Tax=Ptychodera flava TaxID=63121 RepID=UPI00396A46F8